MGGSPNFGHRADRRSVTGAGVSLGVRETPARRAMKLHP